MFQVGDTVVKPSIGICKIKAIRRLEVEDRIESYYVIQSGEVDVLVPKKLADNGALRPPITEEFLQTVYEKLESPYRPFILNPGDDLPQEYQMTALDIKAKLKRRDPMELVEMIRSLYNKEHDYMLDKKETEAYASSLSMLVEEVTYLEKSTKGRIKTKLTKLLAAGRKEGRRLQTSGEM